MLSLEASRSRTLNTPNLDGHSGNGSWMDAKGLPT